jgi:4-diphosphocytidyl-2-C-methyl-D-erythritol kinase
MNALTLAPIAKINLGLFIKGKRPDGYHLLETLYYPVRDLRDQLTLTEIDAPAPTLAMSGIPLDGDPQHNLCLNAWRVLQAEFPDLPPVHIQLTKHIPAGAGLGGGSSDAAYVLRGLNRLFDLGLSRDELSHLAAPLGADVPFFLYDRPMLAAGIGTELTPFALQLPLQLRVFPQPIHSGTVAAYRALDFRQFDPDRSLEEVLQGPIETWAAHLVNDLEVPVFAMYPGLAQVKADLYAQGAVYAAMSGSGSALFGLFPAPSAG